MSKEITRNMIRLGLYLGSGYIVYDILW